MNAGGRLALFAGGLVVAFGAAYWAGSVLVPEGVVETQEKQSQEKESEMGEHGGGEGHSSGHENASGHEHPTDGGPAPEGMVPATAPTYPVGTRVILSADHMPGMAGAEATVSGAFTTTTYSVSYVPTTGGEPVTDHRWVVHEELENPGAAPLADDASVVLLAEHMPGMWGAAAIIDHSTSETVYMVDLVADGMRMTNHKWVVESEMRPVG